MNNSIPTNEEKSSLKNIDYNVGSYEKVVESQQEEEWEKEFDDKFDEYCFEFVETRKQVKSFIQSLIEARVQEAKEEERQFILNILDGIDEADKQMGNKDGGTKAIRLALQSRIIN